jgi:N-acetyl-1-D-myo-inositol-2-amino-2-deoxy-alpha-D-glucopyranoside deacetylase
MADGILVVLAHPDDESLVSGTMAHYADAGVSVTLLCATRGEVGEIADGTDATPESLGAHREQELRDAAAILGVVDVRFLPFRDSGMAGTPENDDPRSLYQAPVDDVIEPMAALMRDVSPRAVVTWDATGGYGHPDHVRVHDCATAAFRRVFGDGGTSALFYAMIPVDAFERVMEEMRRRGVDTGEAPGDVEAMQAMEFPSPNCVIDIGPQFDRKMRALYAHRTQMNSFAPLTQLPEDLRAEVFGKECFVRAVPSVADGTMLAELLPAT